MLLWIRVPHSIMKTNSDRVKNVFQLQLPFWSNDNKKKTHEIASAQNALKMPQI